MIGAFFAEELRAEESQHSLRGLCEYGECAVEVRIGVFAGTEVGGLAAFEQGDFALLVYSRQPLEFEILLLAKYVAADDDCAGRREVLVNEAASQSSSLPQHSLRPLF